MLNNISPGQSTENNIFKACLTVTRGLFFVFFLLYLFVRRYIFSGKLPLYC